MLEEMWKNSAIIAKRNVDDSQNPISVQLSELKQVIDVHSCIVLNQLPDEFHGISIEGYNEVYDIEKVSGKKFKVDYANGVIYFHPNNVGKTFTVDYYGTGCTLLSASRIYTKYDKHGNILETLEELIDKAKLYIKAIETLGGAVEVINKLEQDTENGENLHNNLVEDIVIGTQVKEELIEKTEIANTTIDTLVEKTTAGNQTVNQLVDKTNIAIQKKQELDRSITNATNTNELLTNTNESATQTNLILEQTIASGRDSIDTINATGNKSLVIGASNFVNNQYTWTHNMNNDNLHVTFEDVNAKEPLLPNYKIIDKNNILIRNSIEHPNIKVILSASYYQGNALIGSTVENFAGDSIENNVPKVRIKSNEGIVQNPITDSDAVFMSDGATKLTKKITDIETDLSSVNTEIAGIKATQTGLKDRVDGVELNKLDKTSIINDLTTGGVGKPLSAEQGKVLKGIIDGKDMLLKVLKSDPVSPKEGEMWITEISEVLAINLLGNGVQNLTAFSTSGTKMSISYTPTSTINMTKFEVTLKSRESDYHNYNNPVSLKICADNGIGAPNESLVLYSEIYTNTPTSADTIFNVGSELNKPITFYAGTRYHFLFSTVNTSGLSYYSIMGKVTSHDELKLNSYSIDGSWKWTYNYNYTPSMSIYKI